MFHRCCAGGAIETYAATTAALPRAFISGVHREVPIALLVDDDLPIRYRAPETLMDRLRATEARNASRPVKEGSI
jgi:hypothetical protein